VLVHLISCILTVWISCLLFIFIYLIIFCCTCKNGADYIDSKQSKRGGDHATAFDSWDLGASLQGTQWSQNARNWIKKRDGIPRGRIAPLKKKSQEEKRHQANQKDIKTSSYIRKIQNMQHIGSELTSLRASVTTNREYTNHLLWLLLLPFQKKKNYYYLLNEDKYWKMSMSLLSSQKWWSCIKGFSPTDRFLCQKMLVLLLSSKII